MLFRSIVIVFDPCRVFVHGWAAAHDGEEPGEGVIDAYALSGVDDRLAAMKAAGVAHVLVVRHTLAFASKS